MIAKLLCKLFGHRRRKRIDDAILECPRCGERLVRVRVVKT
jgi:hypothetical protein